MFYALAIMTLIVVVIISWAESPWRMRYWDRTGAYVGHRYRYKVVNKYVVYHKKTQDTQYGPGPVWEVCKVLFRAFRTHFKDQIIEGQLAFGLPVITKWESGHYENVLAIARKNEWPRRERTIYRDWVSVRCSIKKGGVIQ